MTDYRLRQLGSQLKRGTARIVGISTPPFSATDDQSWIIEDLDRRTTEHVLCCVRPSWKRYLKQHRSLP